MESKEEEAGKEMEANVLVAVTVFAGLAAVILFFVVTVGRARNYAYPYVRLRVSLAAASNGSVSWYSGHSPDAVIKESWMELRT